MIIPPIFVGGLTFALLQRVDPVMYSMIASIQRLQYNHALWDANNTMIIKDEY